VEVAVDNMEWLIYDNIQQADFMYSITHRLLENNSMIVGSAIAFEPYFYPQKGRLFSPYSFRKNDSIRSIQLGTEDYEYHSMDWYQTAKLQNTHYWSEPYFDEGGGQMIMTTYSRPLYDKQGKFFGVFTADISLEWLTKLVNDIKPYPHSYTLITGRSGAYIVHPEKEYILNKNILSIASNTTDSSLYQIGYEMINARSGMANLQNDDRLFYVFYAPVVKAGWSVAVVCPHKDVFAGRDKMQTIIISVLIIGLLLLLLFCIYTIKHITRPLTRFSESAVSIAGGNFRTELPVIKSRDEMWKLYKSFDFMQHSLTQYMKELEATTSQKERIESELRIASEIQMSMVPKIFPPFPERNDVDIYASLTSAKEVGGDLYDFFIQDEKLYFIIGDVSGKGVPASLFMAVTRSLFRTIASHLSNPAEIVTSLNESISETNEANMFVTLFIGILDLKTGLLRYCNAGHNPPVILFPTGEVLLMDVKPNMVVGIVSGYSYHSQEIILSQGQSLFLYTDGLTEAENPAQELFSEKRLLEELKLCTTHSAKQIIGHLKQQVKQFTAGAEQSDDLTMLVICYQSLNQRKPEYSMEKILILRNEQTELSRLETFVEVLGEELTLPPALVNSLNLVLEEAIANIILYAYPDGQTDQITLLAKKNNDNRLIFTITDSGVAFDPTKIEEPDITLSAEERPIGGLGMFLIKKIMDEVKYQRVDGKNVLRLTKTLSV
jgi:sigma-B regulation protein RsbU (phosphoserine phosphatase)